MIAEHDPHQISAMMALAAKLSRNGWKGCRENGDVENCLTMGCPCAAAAMARADKGDHGDNR